MVVRVKNTPVTSEKSSTLVNNINEHRDAKLKHTPSSKHNQATYDLKEKEFGKLTSDKYKYLQHVDPGKEVPPPVEDLPSQYVFITTYLNYLVLIIIGHIRDFFAKKLNIPEARYLLEHDGYAPLTSDFDSFYTRRLKHRLDDCFKRPTTGVPGRFITVNERISKDFYYTYENTGRQVDCLNLSSYNYLGFAQSVGQCTDAAEEAINHYGVVAGGTRVAGGTNDSHIVSEKVVADFVGKDDAVIYSQGYGTNAVIFSSLVDKHCLVISDELNHASIRFGVRMSGAVIKIFKHNDMKNLEKVLREQIAQGQPRTHRPWKKILIIVEGLYSMEGTICNLPGLIRLRDKYKFYLFVDEAHSVGAMGPDGRGVCNYFSIPTSKVDILMGTLTKSFGATGGYVAADRHIIERIKVNGLGSVYSEGSAPPVLAQINSSLQTITGEVRPGEGEERLQRLAFNSRYLRLGLKRLGFIVSGIDDSPIVPMMLYNPAKMPAFSRMLIKKNIAVVVVGYPATPLTSSRVRFCLSSSLTKEDLDVLLRAVDEIGTAVGIKISCEPSPIDGKVRRMKIDDVLATLVEDVQKDLSKF
ncbi:hypothetical protein D0Z00_004613 [Geotrichum galactomycetum]|uniref:Uncharacterized protein n=1 Tax=Geotrichum galactomycetum TaxID=27317 RepID=A0ACB6UXX0_9ASCO|nr:hypothetical protein D0Z00_004613 [Geotrichum candidum]